MKQPIALWLVKVWNPSAAAYTPFVAYNNEADAVFFADQNAPENNSQIVKGTFTPDEDTTQ